MSKKINKNIKQQICKLEDLDEKFNKECYTLSIGAFVDKDQIDRLELYMRRNYSKDGHPAIVLNLDSGEFEFTTVVKNKE